MTQLLDIGGVLITNLGDKIPCKLVNVSDKGYLEIYSLDPVAVHSRLQLMTTSPRISTVIKVTSAELIGDSYRIEALSEDPVELIQSRIVSDKIRGILDK